MADSNTESPRCPCGFWGSPQTLGLCSKCYKDHQKKSSDPSPASTTSAATSLPTTTDLSKAFQPPTIAPSTSQGESGKSSENGEEEKEEDSSEKAAEAKADGTNGTNGSNKRDIDEVADPERPVQKNKKRCFTCNCKLELAIREIGRCKCDYVFCQLHRLPEQHDCLYDHKGKGRQEARDKMVSPKKHVGTSLRRLDSDTY